MSKPTWKSLVENLESQDRSEKYHHDVPGQLVTEAGTAQESVQQEVLEEMSAALRRSAEKIHDALESLDAIDEKLKRVQDAREREKLIEAFNAKRRDALEARRHYIIHRESIGFFRNEEVYEEYPIPSKRYPSGPNGEDGWVRNSCD